MITEEIIYLDKKGLKVIVRCPICGAKYWFELNILSQTLSAMTSPCEHLEMSQDQYNFTVGLNCDVSITEFTRKG